ncbi:MAG TPA: hypothetical protein VKQ30_07180 [Ktedonobacterales bacterium]|nr:hypothetical protein [Ktedonobacterales bacterium]
MTGVEAELALLKLDPPDCWVTEPPLDVVEDVLVAVVLVVVEVWAAAVALLVAMWLPTAIPNMPKPSMAAIAAIRFSRCTIRSASAFERLGAAAGVGRRWAPPGTAARSGGGCRHVSGGGFGICK